MISNLNYIGSNGVLINYKYNNKSDCIKFSKIRKYWNYCNEDDFEGGFAQISDDNKILFSISVAQGQGGALIIWDAKEKCVIHISEAAHCVAANVYNNTLYMLNEISSFTMPTHYRVFSIPVGTIDVSNYGHELFCQDPIRIDPFKSNDDFKIIFDNQALLIKCSNDIYCFADDILNPQRNHPKEDCKKYYDAINNIKSQSTLFDMDNCNLISNMLL